LRVEERGPNAAASLVPASGVIIAHLLLDGRAFSADFPRRFALIEVKGTVVEGQTI
jgi:hypothetical protein